jgi:putative type I restriction-modification system, S subunit
MEYVEIKKVGKVVTGNTPSKKEKKYYDQNYIEFVKPSNFIYGKITNIKKGEEYLSYEGMKKGRIANKGDILVTCIGNIGNVGIVDKKVCFNQQINAIKCNKNYINNKYLANVIKYISPLLTHMANKAVVPILNKTQLENIKIPIFPKEIQEEIANILEVIQKNIDKRKEQLLLADELIKSRFLGREIL